VEEDSFLGTAGSLILMKDRLKETFFVANCDSLLDVDFGQVLRWHREHKASLTVIGCHSEIKIPFGVLKISDGRVNKIAEKPTHDVIINTGIYVMEPRVLAYMNPGREMDMNTLIDIVSEKEKVSVYPIYNGWVDIGQLEDYKKFLKKFEAEEKI